MKKLLSVILAILMLLSISVPAVNAIGEEKLPVVYLEGQGMPLDDAEENRIYPFDYDILSVYINNFMPLMKPYIKALITNDFSEYSDMFYDLFSPAFDAYKLGKTGLPEDGSGLIKSAQWRGAGTISNIKKSIPLTNGDYPVYRMHFDWRLSPITLADELNDLIDVVLAETGASKVNIISRCLGTNIAYAYLYKYGTEKVNSCVYYASAVMGLSVCSALFSGELVIDSATLDRFIVSYQNESNLIIQDEETTGLILSFVSLLEQLKVLGLGTGLLEKVLDSIKKDVLPRILKESFGSFASYWSMVEPEYYEKAKDFVFGDSKDEWSGLIALTDEYYEMQKDFYDFHRENSDKVHFAVVTKYGFPCIPLSADAAEESDGFVSVGLASFGATAASSGDKLSNCYIKKAEAEGKSEFISADKKIDASTCFFPETTWFIKGLEHKVFPDCVNDLMIEFVNSNGAMTVNTDPAFTRFLQYNSSNNLSSDEARGTLTPIITEQDTTDTTKDYKQNPIEAFCGFFASLLDFFAKPFKR